MQNKINSFLAVFALLSVTGLGGCASGQLQAVSAQAEDTLAAANDTQLRISKKSLCSSALSAIRREYGDSPDELRALFEFCGWSEHNVNIVSPLADSRGM